VTYAERIPPFVPRPALLLVGHIASSFFLLEQAIWSLKTNDAEKTTDVEVFSQWVMEGGLTSAARDIERARWLGESRIEANSSLVYGSKL